MNINTITAEDLRRMPDKEGLILQGCGGDLTEWVDGINEMLTNAGILKDGSQFENVFAFQHGELTCLLYPFDDVKLCALPGFVDSKNEEKTERNAGYLVVSQSGGGMLRQGTRKGIRRTPANRGMRAHRIVKSLDISEDVCHGLCP